MRPRPRRRRWRTKRVILTHRLLSFEPFPNSYSIFLFPHIRQDYHLRLSQIWDNKPPCQFLTWASSHLRYKKISFYTSAHRKSVCSSSTSSLATWLRPLCSGAMLAFELLRRTAISGHISSKLHIFCKGALTCTGPKRLPCNGLVKWTWATISPD